MYNQEGRFADRFFCIPHSTEAAAVKCRFKEKVDEIQATALARVSQTDLVRGKFKQKINEIKATEEDTIGLPDDLEELDETEMKGTPSKLLGKENKVDDSSREEEKICTETIKDINSIEIMENIIPEAEKETPNVFTVIICRFGLGCSAIAAICK